MADSHPPTHPTMQRARTSWHRISLLPHGPRLPCREDIIDIPCDERIQFHPGLQDRLFILAGNRSTDDCLYTHGLQGFDLLARQLGMHFDGGQAEDGVSETFGLDDQHMMRYIEQGGYPTVPYGYREFHTYLDASCVPSGRERDDIRCLILVYLCFKEDWNDKLVRQFW